MKRGHIYPLSSTILLLSVCIGAITCCESVNGFQLYPSGSNKVRYAIFHTALLASSDKDGSEGQDPLGAMEITSALQRIDKQWQLQQMQSPRTSRWTKLVLSKDGDEDVVLEDPDTFMDSKEVVYLLEPSRSQSSIPSCVILFLGGAGLGQFPQIAYSEFLKRVSDKLNAAVIVAPYQVGLDHFELAKQTGDRMRRALLFCQDDPKRQYPASLPSYALGHSLGCKLQTIYVAATQQFYNGIGFISFNNFSFSKTIQMARTFADQLRSNSQLDPDLFEKGNEIFDTVFGVAETVMGAIGLDFSPTAEELERIVEAKFDTSLQGKSRLFVFDEDSLDSSTEFIDRCDGDGPTVSALHGTHLTPVYFKLAIDQFDDVTPPEVTEMARAALGGFESASFGSEENMDELINEVCDWALGKGPSRSQSGQTGSTIQPPLLRGQAGKT